MLPLKSRLLVLMTLHLVQSVRSQTITPGKGYSDEIGNLVAMMDDLKARVTRSVEGLSVAETDFLLDEEANRIGALIYHLAATEKYYQVFTFEQRDFNEEEKEKWMMALNLGDKAREEIQGKPIDYYLALWDEVRKDTRKQLKQYDDDWLDEKAPGTSMNYHWAWYHVMEHQANHMGQIRFITKRMD